jgi:hypothetical protein
MINLVNILRDCLPIVFWVAGNGHAHPRGMTYRTVGVIGYPTVEFSLEQLDKRGFFHRLYRRQFKGQQI